MKSKRGLSLEIVPKDMEQIRRDISEIGDYPQINVINIPDILRLNNSSVETVRNLQGECNLLLIPHIRAMDFSLEKDSLDFLSSLTHVLIITGDPPHSCTQRVTYKTTAVNMITYVKKNFPHIMVYAGIDPYRQRLCDEFDYIKAKCDAGADGFFTQPIFDINLALLVRDRLWDVADIFWGISPVLNEKAHAYWCNTNHVIFPRDFNVSMEWNAKLARGLISFAHVSNHSAYLMPIRVNIKDYLREVLTNS